MSYELDKSGVLPDLDPHRFFIENTPMLVQLARHVAMNLAYSYRGFHVGVSAVGHIPESGEFAVVSAGNTKKKSREKVCAEKKALTQLANIGMTEAIGLVVVATTDRHKIAEVTGIGTPTLHPCDECRGGVCRHHKLMRDETLMLTTGLTDTTEGNVYQAHLNKDLLNLYDTHDSDALNDNVGHFDAAHWSERPLLYDTLKLTERTWPRKKQRSDAELARAALIADFVV